MTFSPRSPAKNLAVCALVALTGCSSLVPFTQELRSANRLTRDDLKNLQFYTSHKITLRMARFTGDRIEIPSSVTSEWFREFVGSRSV